MVTLGLRLDPMAPLHLLHLAIMARVRLRASLALLVQFRRPKMVGITLLATGKTRTTSSNTVYTSTVYSSHRLIVQTIRFLIALTDNLFSVIIILTPRRIRHITQRDFLCTAFACGIKRLIKIWRLSYIISDTNLARTIQE